MKKITPAEFSRKMKLSRARVSQLMQGILAPAIIALPPGKKRILDEAKALALYRAFSDPAKKRTSALPCDEYSAVRTEGEYYRAALVKQKYEQKLDRYIEKQLVLDQWFKAKKIFRDVMLNIPARVGAILAAEKNEMKITEILTIEISQALNDLIEEIKKAGI